MLDNWFPEEYAYNEICLSLDNVDYKINTISKIVMFCRNFIVIFVWEILCYVSFCK